MFAPKIIKITKTDNKCVTPLCLGFKSCPPTGVMFSVEAAESGDDRAGEVTDGEEPGDGGDETGPGGWQDFPQTDGGRG